MKKAPIVIGIVILLGSLVFGIYYFQQNSRSQRLIEEHRQHLNQLEKTVAELNRQVTEADDALETAEAAFEDAKARLTAESLQRGRQLEKQQQTVNALEDRLEDCSRLLSQAYQQQRQLTEHANELQQHDRNKAFRLEQAQNEIQQLLTENQTLRQDLETLTQKSTRLKGCADDLDDCSRTLSQAYQLQQRLKQSQNQLKEKLDTSAFRLQQAQSEIQQLLTENQNVRAHFDALDEKTAALENCSSNLDDCSQALSTAYAAQRRLQQNENRLVQHNETTTFRLQAAQNEIQQLLQKQHTLEARLESLRAKAIQLNDCSTHLNQANHRRQTLEKAIEAAGQAAASASLRLQQLETETRTLQQENNQLKSRLEEARQQHMQADTCAADLAEAYQQLITLKAAEEKAQSRAKTSGFRLAQAEMEIANLLEEKRTIETQLNVLKTAAQQNAFCSAELADAYRQIVALKQAENQAQASVQAHVFRLEQAEAEIQTLLSENQELTQQLNTLQQTARQQADCTAELNAAYQTLFNLKQAENQALETAATNAFRLTQARSEIDALMQENNALRDQLDISGAEAAKQADCRRQLDQALEKLTRLRQSDVQIRATLAATVARLDQIQEANTALQAENTLLKKRLHLTDDELAQLMEDLNALEADRKLAQKRAEQLATTYQKLLAALREEIQNKDATLDQIRKKLHVSFVGKILFQFGEASITPQGEKQLAKVAQVLSRVADSTIRVIGHTDNVPISLAHRDQFPSNWELSAARASAVVRFFVERGNMDPAHLEAVGRSYYQPVADNTTSEGRALNRRVEIVITPFNPLK